VENVATGLQWPHLDDEKSQEHWQQEELVEEINLENNDGKDFHCMKEECFQDIVDESRILDVVGIRRKMKIFSNGKLLIQPKIATLMSNRELILLNHGSKALLAKQCNHILVTSGSVLLQYTLGMLLTP
jgi:hypothetical protein